MPGLRRRHLAAIPFSVSLYYSAGGQNANMFLRVRTRNKIVEM